MKLYDRFTQNDAKIAISKWNQGWNMTEIGKYLGFSKSTISKQLKKARTFKWKTTHTWAKKIYSWRFHIWLIKKSEITNNLKEFKQEKLTIKYQSFIDFTHELINKKLLNRKKLFSPEAIIDLFSEKFKNCRWAKHPQKTQFYNWIKTQQYGFKKYMFPNNGGAKYKKKPNKPRVPRFNPIETREQVANLRLELGHFEIDSVEGKKSDKFALATMIDRRSQKIAISLYKKYCPQSFLIATRINLSKFPLIKSVTLDNGNENLKLGELEKERIKLYNTNPYASWEKGSIENSHRFIRRIKPKGVTLDDLSIEDVLLIEKYINSYPRKILKSL